MDLFNRKKVSDLENKVQHLENRVNGVYQPIERNILMDTVKNEYHFRTKQTIKTWRDSLDYAEYSDNRYYLYQIFREMYLDSHIMSTVLLRKSRVNQLPFEIENDMLSDDEQENLRKYFESKWFYDFMNNASDYLYEGYTALEISKVNDDGSLKINKIPLSHLRPINGEFVKMYTDQRGTSLSSPELEPFVMEIYNQRDDLGLYTKIAPLFLWARNAHQAWSQYTELFGMPIRVGKTVKQDAKERNKLFEMLKQMGSSLSVLLDKDEDIQLIQTSNSDAFRVYLEFIKLCNSEINKLILGATMVNEDGSSYSQSNVHQKQFDSLIKSDIKTMEYIVNDILFPKMVNLGLIPEGCRFVFDTSESLDIFQKFEIDKALLPYYELDIEYMNKMYNTNIIGSKGFLPTNQNNE